MAPEDVAGTPSTEAPAEDTLAADTPATLTDWLRRRTVDDLARLMRRRPDLAAPAPPDLPTLANRISVRSSISRALDTLDAFTLRVLEAVVLTEPAGADQIHTDLGGDEVATSADVGAALDRLTGAALVWGPAHRLRSAGGVADQLGAYPAGLGRPAAELLVEVPVTSLAPVLRERKLADQSQPRAGLLVARSLQDADGLRREIDGLPATERSILQRLAAGPPLGSIANAYEPPETDERDRPVAALVRAGLLVPVDPGRVELPREVGVLLRGDRPLGDVPADAPAIELGDESQEGVDRTGAVAVLETLRLLDALGTSWAAEPPPQLRSGGLGVRELRRTSRELDVDEAHAALLIEVAVAADLIAAPPARDVPWLPTTDWDAWAALAPADRWIRVAEAWRAMTRQPHLVGERDERGKARAALSYEVERSATVSVRREVLLLLADLPAGTLRQGRDGVLARLAWARPRRIGAIRAAATAVLVEAERLGVTGGGGLTGYGRALLDGTPATAATRLRDALPEPVEEFLVQPDLSVVVPGPPSARLAAELSLVADLESAGGASVYRVSESSLRRAFDAGRTTSQVQALFSERSRTPVPQALAYLIDDLGRRHGVLRTGVAGAYLRSDDEALLNRAVSDRATAALSWRRLAPTVALSSAPVERMLELLRSAGYAPAAENEYGSTLAGRTDPPRARPQRPRSARVPITPTVRDEQLIDIVRRMRTGDDMARTAHRVSVTQTVPGVTSARTFEVLREAIRSDRRVWVAYVDAAGTALTHILAPLSLGGGFLRGHDADSGDFRSIPLHRITSVNVLEDEPNA